MNLVSRTQYTRDNQKRNSGLSITLTAGTGRIE